MIEDTCPRRSWKTRNIEMSMVSHKNMSVSRRASTQYICIYYHLPIYKI